MEEEELKIRMLEYVDWYTRTDVMFEIVKQLHNKETVFINPFDQSKATRCMKIHKVDSWQKVTQWIGFWRRPYNVYYSLAKYKNGIPNQVFDHEERKELNKEWNHGQHWKEIETFDMLIDVDGEDNKHCELLKPEFLAISELFKDVPHSLRFSGCGFHLIIPGEFLFKPKSQEWYNPDKIISFFSLWEEILRALKKDYCFAVDETIADSRRVTKAPYTLANYEDGAYVCYPYFKHSEISEILISQFTTSWILSSTSSIRNRGVPVLNLERVNDADPSSAMRAVCKKLLGKKWDKYERLIS